MRIECISGDIRTVKADMIVVNLFEGTGKPGGATAAVDAAIGGVVSEAIRGGDFEGKLGESFFLRPAKGLASPRVLVVGLGKKEKFTADAARQVALPVLKVARRMKLSTVASVVHGAGTGGLSPQEAARFSALGAALSSFEYDRYKGEKGHRVARFLFVERDAKAFPAVRAGVSFGVRLGEAINWGRELVATPPAELRPDDLARAARKVGAGLDARAAAKIRVRVFGVSDLEAMGRRRHPCRRQGKRGAAPADRRGIPRRAYRGGMDRAGRKGGHLRHGRDLPQKMGRGWTR